MKEKILELSDANSEKLQSLGGSLHNPNMSIGEGDAFINLSEHSPSKAKLDRVQTVFSKQSNLNLEKKLKCSCFFRNINKLKVCMKSFLNSLYCLSGKKIRVQVCLIYSISMFLLSTIIILLKLYHVLDSINSLADKKFFLLYVNNIIDSQREIKVQFDEINNNDLISEINGPLLFLRIYTEEMVQNKILNSNTLILEKDLKNMYEDLGENYILSKDLYELSSIKVESEGGEGGQGDGTGEEGENNIKNMLPFYYHFSPVLIEHINNCGIKLNNFYFTANGNDEEAINSLYFKYPLEQIKIAPDVPQQNDKIYDFIFDPFVDSTFDLEGQKDIINNIRSNNWFYNCLQNDNTHFRIFKINKLSEEKARKDYFILFERSNNLTYLNDENSNSTLFFTFSMKINHNEDNYPFIHLNSNNDILYFDYLSLYNFKENFASINTNFKEFEQKFEIDYDLDSGKNILIRIPKFISNIHEYSMTEKDDDKSLNKDQSKLLKYNEMEQLDKFYEINYYFQKDSLIFKLIYFLNEFFNFKKSHPEYLTKEYDLIRDSIETASDHPCIFQGTDEYYEKIKTEYEYDCLDDFCLYNNCDQTENKLENYYFIPNCYCIPLYCRDSQSPNSEFHDKLEERKSNINSAMNENYYSFTSKYEDYLIKKEYNFSKIDQFFDRKNFIFNCQLSFGHKNDTYNNLFKTKIKMQNLNYNSGDNNLLIFFMNNNMTSFLVNNLKNTNMNYFYYCLIAYYVFLLCTSAFLIKYIMSQVNNLLKRMEKVKKIRTTLIKSEEEKYYSEEPSSANNNSINESMTILKDDNISIKSDIDINPKSKKEKEEKKEENEISEMDELDTLMQLINENLSDFQIKFNLNEDMNTNINEIKKQYNGIIKINQYKNKLLNDDWNKSFEPDGEEEEEIKKEKEINTENFDNLSLKMFYELLSTSTTEMDFSNIKRNFYYRKHDGNLLFNLKDILPYFDGEDSNGNGEITNLKKMQNLVNYFYNNIHTVWENEYKKMKKEEKKI